MGRMTPPRREGGLRDRTPDPRGPGPLRLKLCDQSDQSIWWRRSGPSGVISPFFTEGTTVMDNEFSGLGNQYKRVLLLGNMEVVRESKEWV